MAPFATVPDYAPILGGVCLILKQQNTTLPYETISQGLQFIILFLIIYECHTCFAHADKNSPWSSPSLNNFRSLETLTRMFSLHHEDSEINIQVDCQKDNKFEVKLGANEIPAQVSGTIDENGTTNFI